MAGRAGSALGNNPKSGTLSRFLNRTHTFQQLRRIPPRPAHTADIEGPSKAEVLMRQTVHTNQSLRDGFDRTANRKSEVVSYSKSTRGAKTPDVLRKLDAGLRNCGPEEVPPSIFPIKKFLTNPLTPRCALKLQHPQKSQRKRKH